jgi:hypothetical protein
MSNEKPIPLNHNTVHAFKLALYRGACQVCEEVLEWEASFDADSPSYAANCCGLDYWMRPEVMRVMVEPEEEGEE